MKLIKWNNFDNNFPSISDVFNDFFRNDNLSFATGTRLPAVNIKEDEKQYTIMLAVPGLKKDDCKITVEDNNLIISAETKDGRSDEGDNYSRYEYNFSSFSRSFTLPQNADVENISAEQKDGELIIELPKKEGGKSSRKEITIK